MHVFPNVKVIKSDGGDGDELDEGDDVTGTPQFIAAALDMNEFTKLLEKKVQTYMQKSRLVVRSPEHGNVIVVIKYFRN